jgi:hypothetical protein
VVGTPPLTILELIQTGAHLLRADRLSDARGTPTVPVALRGLVELRGEKVESEHRRILPYRG